jgi:hypothetical protein
LAGKAGQYFSCVPLNSKALGGTPPAPSIVGSFVWCMHVASAAGKTKAMAPSVRDCRFDPKARPTGMVASNS